MQRAQAIREAVSVHAQVSRNSFMWDQIEQHPGALDWSRTDSVVSSLTAARIAPLFVIVGSPTWANGADPGGSSGQYYIPAAGPAFDQWLARFEAFVTQAVQRYRGRVERWEIWNEENEHFMWKPAPSIALYARLYTGLRDAILAADPNAQVAIGGLASFCCVAGGQGDIPGGDFVKGLLRLGTRMDYVAVHPYASANQPPDQTLKHRGNFTDIAAYHRLLVAAGHSVPLWVTEWGWSSAAVGLDMQARYVAQSLRMIRHRYPYVTVATYFIDHDVNSYRQGLFRASLARKPAASAFATFMSTQTQNRRKAPAPRSR